MVKKAQLLEDATDLTDRIKGRMVKKEQTSGSSSKPTNSKKRPFSITYGPSQERKPKVFTPSAHNKPRCKHCDKLGHTAEECWRKGGEPREQDSVGITSPLPARAAGTPTSGSKTTLQSCKARNAYHIVLQSSGNRETPRPPTGSGQIGLPQNQRSQTHVEATRATPQPATRVGPKQHNAEENPWHTPAETKKLTEHRSNHVRPESHDTSTNILELHEVGKEQPGVTTRDTKQPREKHRLTTGTTTSDLHKVKGPQAKPPCTSDTPRGQGTTPYSATTDGTKERNLSPFKTMAVSGISSTVRGYGDAFLTAEQQERFATVKTKLCGHKAVDVADLEKNGMHSISEEDGSLTSTVNGTQIRITYDLLAMLFGVCTTGHSGVHTVDIRAKGLGIVGPEYKLSATFSTCTKADSDMMFWTIQNQSINMAEEEQEAVVPADTTMEDALVEGENLTEKEGQPQRESTENPPVNKFQEGVIASSSDSDEQDDHVDHEEPVARASEKGNGVASEIPLLTETPHQRTRQQRFVINLKHVMDRLDAQGEILYSVQSDITSIFMTQSSGAKYMGMVKNALRWLNKEIGSMKTLLLEILKEVRAPAPPAPTPPAPQPSEVAEEEIASPSRPVSTEVSGPSGPSIVEEDPAGPSRPVVVEHVAAVESGPTGPAEDLLGPTGPVVTEADHVRAEEEAIAPEPQLLLPFRHQPLLHLHPPQHHQLLHLSNNHYPEPSLLLLHFLHNPLHPLSLPLTFLLLLLSLRLLQPPHQLEPPHPLVPLLLDQLLYLLPLLIPFFIPLLLPPSLLLFRRVLRLMPPILGTSRMSLKKLFSDLY
ncbi:hypothetical protein Taro_031974 [Colocasia esculenta]|uniref:Uncharacterized protein n=1 Tax=Colocasia esculenta TaxID=4460 RepID=A0A843W811_COLES|nr:hypothetical protein [Colocasia esculenta]